MDINHLLTGMILQVYATYHLLGEPDPQPLTFGEVSCMGDGAVWSRSQLIVWNLDKGSDQNNG